MLFRKLIITFVVPLLVLSAPSVAIAGPGDLLVSPVRVIFQGRNQVAELTLVNKGDKPATYRISFENRRMNTDGSFVPIDEAENGELFAEKLVRFAPRRIQLPPNQPQTVRLMARKPSDLADGEYRSHLHLAAVPDDAGSSSIERTAGDDEEISITLTPIYGVTIPIIVRHGTLESSAQITSADVESKEDGSGVISLMLERQGNRSLYGDFDVKVAGIDTTVLRKRGIALYTPNTQREVKIDLPIEVFAALRGKSIEVVFNDKSQGATSVVANASLGPL